MHVPYKVLASYYPTSDLGSMKLVDPSVWVMHPAAWPWGWKAWRIGRDLTQMTANLGLVPHPDPAHGPLDVSWSDTKLHAEVRRTTTYGKGGDEWHQDGDTTPGANMNCALVFWSNSHPTQLSWKGKIWQPQPFEVVLALNREVHHRRPPDAPKHRFLFRQRMMVPEWMK